MRAAVMLSLVLVVSARTEPKKQGQSPKNNSPPNSNRPLESDELIDAINKAQNTWKAGRNFDSSLKMDYLKFLCGLITSNEELDGVLEGDGDDSDPPPYFDARQHWEKCPSLKKVIDQGRCGSCWAVSAAAAFTDRKCIATNGQFNRDLSAQDVLTCGPRGGCSGDDVAKAWKHFRNTGICTGGHYDSKEGCQPYTIPPEGHHLSVADPETPKCESDCYNKNYEDKVKAADLHKVKDAHIVRSTIRIQKEILKHGPVTTGMRIYDDFLSYKSGIYQRTNGANYTGRDHAVKVIGWGTEDGTDYWLVANSWGSDWGDNGFFKIRRGTNECNFEFRFSLGHPEV